MESKAIKDSNNVIKYSHEQLSEIFITFNYLVCNSLTVLIYNKVNLDIIYHP